MVAVLADLPHRSRENEFTDGRVRAGKGQVSLTNTDGYLNVGFARQSGMKMIAVAVASEDGTFNQAVRFAGARLTCTISYFQDSRRRATMTRSELRLAEKPIMTRGNRKVRKKKMKPFCA